MKLLPCARIQARAICPGVAICLSAMTRMRSTRDVIFGKFSSPNMDSIRLKSFSFKSLLDLIFPVNKPRPRGARATIMTPSSVAVCTKLGGNCSVCNMNGEYSIWMAEMGCTAWARHKPAAVQSERPRYLTFPSLDETC